MAAIHGLLQEYVTQKHLPYTLNAPSPTERGETAVMSILNKQFEKIGVPITVKCGKYTIPNVVGINKVAGTPKADLVLVSWNEKANRLEQNFYLSHKMGSSAKDFQQYSGTTDKADGKKRGSISRDAAVVAFLKAIAQPGIYKKIVKGKERFYRPITSDVLIGKSVYGPEYSTGAKNEDNIHCIAQGDPVLTKESSNVYTLKFTAGIHFHGDVSPFKRDPYRAVIGARFTEGRNFTVNGKSYTGVRVLILPLVVLGGKSQVV